VSDDGAHLGYGRSAALDGVMGGDEPPKLMSTAEMREYIVTAPEPPQNYDDAGRLVAKYTLAFLERHPEASSMPADSEHDWPLKADGSPDWDATPTVKVEGLYDYMQRVEPDGRAHV
jgi:hypothetical protein